MAIPPAPPRMTGDPAVDIAATIQYLHEFYRAAVLEGAFLLTQQQIESGDFNPLDLPDPASTNLATAQDTANNAYILANSAAEDAKLVRASFPGIMWAMGKVARLVRQMRRIVLFGNCTISDAVNNVVVNLPVTMPDTNYRVLATAESYTGTPPTGALQIITITKTTTSFTLFVNTAPGVGNSTTFAYGIFKN